MVLTRNAEATQQRLMDAALELYAERGYAGTCLDAILKRASSSKGAFYHHFISKEQLTAQALELHWESLLHTVQCSWARGKSPQEKLDGLLRLLGVGGDHLPACPLGLLGFESRSLPGQVQETLARGLERWSRQLSDLLADLGVADPARCKALAEQLFLTYEGGVLMWRISGSHESLTAGLLGWRERVLAAARAQQPNPRA